MEYVDITSVSERIIWYWILGPLMMGASAWALSLLWGRSHRRALNVCVTALVVITLLWSLSGLVIRTEIYDSPWFYTIARLTAAFTQWMLAAFGGVVLLFVGHLKSKSDLIFITAGGIAAVGFGLITATSGLIIESVGVKDGAMVASYGILAPYMIAFDIVFSFAIFRLARRAIRQSEDLVFSFQLQRILFSSLVAIATIVLINGLMTLLTKRVLWVPTGPVTLTIFYLSLAYTIGYGHKIAIEKKISSVIKAGSQPTWVSVMAILGFISLLEVLSKEPKKLAAFQVPFGDKHYRISIELVNRPIAEPKLIGLNNEARPLSEELKQQIHSFAQLPAFKTRGASKREAPVAVSDFTGLLDQIKHHLQDLYGRASVAGQLKEFEQVHQQILDLMPIRKPVTFVGEVGSGRAEAAHRLHFLRTGELDLLPIDMALATAAGDLSLYLNRRIGSSTPAGVLLRHVNVASPAQLGEAAQVLGEAKTEFIYLTSSVSLGGVGEDGLFAFAFAGPEVQIPALRGQPAQIGAVVFEQINSRNQEWGLDVTHLDQRVFQGLMDNPWPGNYNQLKAVTDEIIIAGANCMNAQYEAWLGTGINSDFAALSPLKAAEKREIENSLQRNNWNKTKTKNELEMSINTLNTKLKQYGIKLPNRLNRV